MLAIQYIKSVPRYLAVQIGKRWWPSVVTSMLSPTRMSSIESPKLPGPKWVRIRTHLSGICGSDLATITAKGSAYFSPLISTPFVYGHENVGTIFEVGDGVDRSWMGKRVVIEPALPCVVRGIDPVCEQCQKENFASCENVTHGDISEGIQTGYCRDTGGGWSQEFVAHEWQLYDVPDGLSDEAAVLIEPFCCALHGVLRAEIKPQDRILVQGCGSIGLLTVAAIRATGASNELVAIAKYPHQKELALDLGADETLRPGRHLLAQVKEHYSAEQLQPELGKPILLGGADLVFDCVGSATSIDDSLRFTRAQGRTILVGMPGIPKGIDWTAIWYKELKVCGAYAYGMESFQGARRRTFEIAIEMIENEWAEKIAPIVGKKYSIKEYRKAIATATFSGKSGVAKTVFTFSRNEQED